MFTCVRVFTFWVDWVSCVYVYVSCVYGGLGFVCLCFRVFM